MPFCLAGKWQNWSPMLGDLCALSCFNRMPDDSTTGIGNVPAFSHDLSGCGMRMAIPYRRHDPELYDTFGSDPVKDKKRRFIHSPCGSFTLRAESPES
jgi:hypothetical protein